MIDFVPYLGFILALVFAFYAFMSRKQVLDVRALLVDAGVKSQQQRERLKQAENQATQSQKQLSQVNEQLKKLEKKSADARVRQEQLEKELQQARSQTEDQVQLVRRQLEHQTEQNQVLTAQLSEAIREKKQIQEQATQLEKNLEKQSSSITQELEAKLAVAQENYKTLKNEHKRSLQKLNKLQSLLKTVDPAETKRLKARLSRTEQLYKSMKGLREMAEERNQNWETAIRLLAAHITNKSVMDHKEPIGPILGEALQKIGSSLEVNAPDSFAHDGEQEPAAGSAEKAAKQEKMLEENVTLAAANTEPKLNAEASESNP
ncbi:MAG: hypothetical protein ACOH5I_03280 [Oligoflexus sp.]